MVSNVKQQANKTKQAFLRTFFSPSPRYEEKIVNGFYLVKQWDGNNHDWIIAVYTEESFRNRKSFLSSKNGDQAKAPSTE